jgi:hypothetical protein
VGHPVRRRAGDQKAYQLVTNALQNYPPEIAQVLQADPNFIADKWKAAEADQLAQGQAPASEQIPAVESAGGATPGGTGGQPNPVHAAFQNAGRGLPRGFGGG